MVKVVSIVTEVQQRFNVFSQMLNISTLFVFVVRCKLTVTCTTAFSPEASLFSFDPSGYVYWDDGGDNHDYLIRQLLLGIQCRDA